MEIKPIPDWRSSRQDTRTRLATRWSRGRAGRSTSAATDKNHYGGKIICGI